MIAMPSAYRSLRSTHLRRLCAALGMAALAATARAEAAAAPAAGSSSASSTTSASTATTPAPFPAKVEDFATCPYDATWDATKNRQLSDAYNANRWAEVEQTLAEFLKGLGPCNALAKHNQNAPDQKLVSLVEDEAYFSVLFLDETLTAPAVVRVIIHKSGDTWRCQRSNFSDLPEIYGYRIGSLRMYDVRLLPAGVLVTSQYNASPSPNPLIGQIPTVLSTLAGGVKTTIPLPPAAPPPAGGTDSILKVLFEQPSQVHLFSEEMKEDQFSQLQAAQAFKSQVSLRQFSDDITTGDLDDLAQKIKAPFLPYLTPPRACANVGQDDLPKPISLSYLVRRISVPHKFRTRFLNVPSVIPTLNVTDQLSFSSDLELYLLDSQRQRAANQPAVSDIEKSLFAGYLNCRGLVSVGLETQLSWVIARVHFPAASAVWTSRLKLHLTASRLKPDGTQEKVDDTNFSLTPSTTLAGEVFCWHPKVSSPSGPLADHFEIAAELSEATRNFPVARANALLFDPVLSGSVTGTLFLSDRSLAWDSPLKASYVISQPKTGQRFELEVFDLATGKEVGRRSIPSPSSHDLDVAQELKGDALLQTALLGVGDRLVVLKAADQPGARWLPVARARVTVTDVVPSGPGAAASAAPAAPTPAGCLAVSDAKQLAELNGSQQEDSRFYDLFGAYSGLLALNIPSAAPATPVATQYTMGTLSRWGFSLGAAWIVRTSLHTPSPLLADPLSWVALDWHPWRYDETRYLPSFAERFRVFGGVSITPDIGGVAGVGLGMVRGLTLEAGYGVVLATAVTGPPPVCPTMMMCPGPVTGRRGVGVTFLGLGYTFQ